MKKCLQGSIFAMHLYSINRPKFGGNFPGVPRPLQLFANIGVPNAGLISE